VLDEADQLYGLGLEEFTEARDALAKRLRADKRREDADAVHALRKPSVAAWAINQAVRGHREETHELDAAGAALRKAHEALLGGGDRDKARATSERERDAVRALTRRALDALGERASEPTAEKIRTTLHAVATDDELREEVLAGRLQHESEGGASGWPGASGDEGESAAPRKPAAKSKPETRADGRPERRRASRASGVTDAERRRVDASKRAQREAERAQEAEADADAAAESAREALEEAEKAAREARARADEADAAERAARRGVKEAEAQAERRRTEARRAVKAARALS
jgi:hypothetical protein